MKEFCIDDVKVVWLGHAGFLLKYNNKRIVIDPYNVLDPVEKADAILITHEHFDHCDTSSVQKLLRENTIVVCPGVVAQKISNLTNNIRIVKPEDSLEIDDVEIQAFWAYNLNKPFHPKGKGVGFVIKLGGITVYHAGDTDFIPEMKNLKDITLALIPIGGTYTMNVQEAAQAVNAFKPKYAFPMHYNTFPEIKADPNKFKELVKESKVIL